jgi:raffinose/stachyose/melibiose transport system substrate-binding protein
MKKKHAGMITIFILILLVGASCNRSGKTDSGSARQVILYNNKIEITGALEAMAAEYNASHPNTTLIVNTTGSDAYAAELKTRFAGGEEPDIFVITGTEQMLLYLEYLEDLSGQSWVADMVDIAKPNITHSGKIYGFPVGIEGYGYMYNKDAFAKAGIAKVPLTLNELADAADKLKAAGYTYPFINTFGEWYQSGMFYFSAALAQQDDPFAFIEGLNNGTKTIIDNKAFTGLADMISIDFAGCESPLNTDFSAQVAGFAGDKAVVSMGGTWNQPTLDDAKPGMNVSLMPLPFMSDQSANDVLYAGVTNYWAINKNSSAKESSKEFLTWLTNDTAGRRYLTTEMKNIPAFKSIAADSKAIGPLGQSLAEYLSAGKVRGIYNSRYPFSATQEFGISIQKYAAGRIDRQQLLQEFQSAWDSNKTN